MVSRVLDQEVLAWVDGIDGRRHYLHAEHVRDVEQLDLMSVLPMDVNGVSVQVGQQHVLAVHFMNGSLLLGFGEASEVMRSVQKARRGLGPGDY